MEYNAGKTKIVVPAWVTKKTKKIPAWVKKPTDEMRNTRDWKNKGSKPAWVKKPQGIAGHTIDI